MTQTNSIYLRNTDQTLSIEGEWVLRHYSDLQHAVRQHQDLVASTQQLDFAQLQTIDTAGAGQLCRLLGAEKLIEFLDNATHLSNERKALLQTVANAMIEAGPPPSPKKTSSLGQFFGNIGAAIQNFWNNAIELLAFIGLTLQSMAKVALRPSQWRINALVQQIEETGLNAVPIIALLTFLVGAVIAFLGSTILKDFGATLYTVDLVGFSFMREFAVLLTAILMAGRTASAFTAQLGSMKANEEIDALRAQGLDPIQILVIPRVFALLVSLPLLTFIGMVSGIIGGALVCYWVLNISPTMFFSLFQEDLTITNFYVGMAKAPLFAFLIAVIGCLQGFKVSGSAQSVGEHTTAAVVHSIFIVIVLDAIAALYYMEMGW